MSVILKIRRLLCVFLSLCCGCLIPSTRAEARSKPLLIYFIDVEGGQATLLVSPSGQSLLFDAGNPGKSDAKRILLAAKDAKVKQIDFLLITHFHRDHVGGVSDLVELMKVETFVDHGPDMESSGRSREDYAAYETLAAKVKRLIVKPGDGLPIRGLTARIVAANGEHLDHPLPNAGTANSFCDVEPRPEPDDSESARSVGTLVTLGKFRFLDLGDLPRQQELELACPNNMLGTVDLFLVTHHGAGGSNAKALDWALHPRVAVIENGADNAGDPAAWQTVYDSPGLEDLWQLHYSVDAAKDHNVAEPLIANLNQKSDGHYIKVSAQPDGSFTVVNSRNGKAKTYRQ